MARTLGLLMSHKRQKMLSKKRVVEDTAVIERTRKETSAKYKPLVCVGSLGMPKRPKSAANTALIKVTNEGHEFHSVILYKPRKDFGQDGGVFVAVHVSQLQPKVKFDDYNIRKAKERASDGRRLFMMNATSAQGGVQFQAVLFARVFKEVSMGKMRQTIGFLNNGILAQWPNPDWKVFSWVGSNPVRVFMASTIPMKVCLQNKQTYRCKGTCELATLALWFDNMTGGCTCAYVASRNMPKSNK